MLGDEWKGYYLTAYGIAVKHGFTGTEEEWIASLKGDKGNTGAVFTPSVSSIGVLSWTNDGGLENPASVNIKGPKGDQGIPGTAAAAGATFTPSVSSDGTLSWTNDGGLENPESVNIKGPAGTTNCDQRYCSVSTGSRGKYDVTVADSAFALAAGAKVTVTFTEGNEDYNLKINVNATGAKSVYHNGTSVMQVPVNSTYDMVYDGTRWNIVGMKDTDTNTTYSNASATKAGLMSADSYNTLQTLNSIMTSGGYVKFSKVFAGYQDVTVTISAGSYYYAYSFTVSDWEQSATEYSSRVFYPMLLSGGAVNVSFCRDALVFGFAPRLYVSRMPGADTTSDLTVTVRVYWMEE